ncbi:uncharacterized protein B4U80_12614, partial [Leptotrombidium deliense]
MRGVSPLEQKNPGARSKSCFKCGQPGHFKGECPITKNPQQSRPPARSPGTCPKCKRGARWSTECRSSTDAFENPLPKNGIKGPSASGSSNVQGSDGTTFLFHSGGSSIQSLLPIKTLYRGTTESGGLDLSASSYQVLTPDMGVQLMPTGVQGPIPPGTPLLPIKT